MRYNVRYRDGEVEATIDAESPEEAVEEFINGDCEYIVDPSIFWRDMVEAEAEYFEEEAITPTELKTAKQKQLEAREALEGFLEALGGQPNSPRREGVRIKEFQLPLSQEEEVDRDSKIFGTNIHWKFFFKSGEDCSLPETAHCIGSYVMEDHLEQLWIDDEGNFYRYAGGGRGFYWTQKLDLKWAEEVK